MDTMAGRISAGMGRTLTQGGPTSHKTIEEKMRKNDEENIEETVKEEEKGGNRDH